MLQSKSLQVCLRMSNCFPRLKANTYCFNWMKSVHIFLSQHKNSFHTKLFFRSIGGSHFCIYLVSQVEGGGLPLQKKTFRGEWFGATLVGWLRRVQGIIISKAPGVYLVQFCTRLDEIPLFQRMLSFFAIAGFQEISTE